MPSWPTPESPFREAPAWYRAWWESVTAEQFAADWPEWAALFRYAGESRSLVLSVLWLSSQFADFVEDGPPPRQDAA